MNPRQHDDPDISALYSATRREQPAAATDERILAAARQRAGRRERRWLAPSLATAAVLVLGLSLTLRVWQQAPPAPPPPGPAGATDAPALPAVVGADPEGPAERGFAGNVEQEVAAEPASALARKAAPAGTAAPPPATSQALQDERARAEADAAVAAAAKLQARAPARAVSTQRVGPWDPATPLDEVELARAFPSATLVWRDGADAATVTVAVDGSPAYRLHGPRGGLASRIEILPAAAPLQPDLPFGLAAERLPRSDCKGPAERQRCRDRQRPDLVYELVDGRLTRVTWERRPGTD